MLFIVCRIAVSLGSLSLSIYGYLVVIYLQIVVICRLLSIGNSYTYSQHYMLQYLIVYFPRTAPICSACRLPSNLFCRVHILFYPLIQDFFAVCSCHLLTAEVSFCFYRLKITFCESSTKY